MLVLVSAVVLVVEIEAVLNELESVVVVEEELESVLVVVVVGIDEVDVDILAEVEDIAPTAPGAFMLPTSATTPTSRMRFHIAPVNAT